MYPLKTFMWKMPGRMNASSVQQLAPTSAIRLAKLGTASTTKPVSTTRQKRSMFWKYGNHTVTSSVTQSHQVSHSHTKHLKARQHHQEENKHVLKTWESLGHIKYYTVTPSIVQSHLASVTPSITRSHQDSHTRFTQSHQALHSHTKHPTITLSSPQSHQASLTPRITQSHQALHCHTKHHIVT